VRSQFLIAYLRLSAWKSTSPVTFHGAKIIEVHFSVLKGFGNNYTSVVKSNGNSVSQPIIICTPVIVITECVTPIVFELPALCYRLPAKRLLLAI